VLLFMISCVCRCMISCEWVCVNCGMLSFLNICALGTRIGVMILCMDFYPKISLLVPKNLS
jgi:hypothetical protein